MEPYLGIASIAAVMGIVEVGKRAFPDVKKGMWTLVALLSGIVWNVGLTYVAGLDVATSVPVGVMAGLAAAGVVPATMWQERNHTNRKEQ